MILNEQKELRVKDQTIFNQVCLTRDHFQTLLQESEFQLNEAQSQNMEL